MNTLRAVCRSRAARLVGALAVMASVATWAAAGPATSQSIAASTTSVGVPAQTRTYYIAADEVVWDYAPAGSNLITGQPFGDQENTYVQTGPGRIGSKYIKCLYRGYTDGTFNTLQQRPASEAYLGYLGPVIRAQVGDTLRVVFRNRCSMPTSIHPHGVFYDKAGEGAPYNDGTSGGAKADDGVPTGSTYTYTWQVPDRAGPGPMEGSSVMWMYHSHTDEIGDTYAGLTGPMVVTRKGQAKADGSPVDVDRELFELFMVSNENKSPYLDRNVQRFAQQPYADPADEDFQESNLMHSINGYVYGNQPLPTIQVGQRVRWYVMSMGTEVDLHTPHWHGNTVTVGGMRMDVVQLLPAGMITADMVPDDPGIWLFHCHVNDHIYAGMMTRYQVVS
jgi:manganese oxidase